jgi:hypothetical protein
MSTTDLPVIIPGSPALSILLWIVVAVVMLYLARCPVHRAIRSLSRVIHNAMRLWAKSVLRAEQRLVQRNKEVVLAAGRESVGRLIEREFHRVNTVVQRDLGAYPALQRTLSDQITRIEEDYKESAELPPPPPTWVDAVETVSKIRSTADPTVGNILKEIEKTTNKQYKETIDEYRKSMGERHALLGKMMPYWRKLIQTLEEVGKTITGLREHARVIDSKMEDYERIQAQTGEAERTLTSSSMTQFVISGFALLIAFGGVVINFNLIALPMSEMVGGGSYIGPFKTSNVAALVIILVEVAMGLYLMESLRITKLFPLIGSMDDRMRTRMIWVTFGILLILACVESALAFMRDRIAADMQALRQSLAAADIGEPVSSWIPTVGQMVLGFILPFALTFVAIPLESFVQASRTVMGAVVAGLLRALAFLLRLLGNIAHHLGEFLVNIYDLLIFPPLWVEKMIHGGHQTKISPQKEMM